MKEDYSPHKEGLWSTQGTRKGQSSWIFESKKEGWRDHRDAHIQSAYTVPDTMYASSHVIFTMIL